MFISFNPQIKPINKNINTSYFNRDMKADCVELSFKRKKKDIDKQLQLATKQNDTEALYRIMRDKMRKDIIKLGYKDNDVAKVVNNPKAYKKLNEYMQTNGDNGFYRPMNLGEAFSVVSQELTPEQATTYLKIQDVNTKDKTPFARVLKNKEAINISKNIKFEDIPRYLELVDNNRNGEPFLYDRLEPQKAFISIYNNFNDEQAEVYARMLDTDFSQFYDLDHDYNTNYKAAEFINKEDYYKQFLTLTSENVTERLSRPLGNEEAVAVIAYGFNDKQIQSFIDYMDANDEETKTSTLFTRPILFMEAMEVVKNGYDKEKTQFFIDMADAMKYTNEGYYSTVRKARETINLIKIGGGIEQAKEFSVIKEDHKYIYHTDNIFDVFKDKEKYARFHSLQEKNNNITNKPLSFIDAFEMVSRGFDDEQIKTFEFMMLPQNNLGYHHVLDLFKDEERYKEFINLRYNQIEGLEREFNAKEILYCVDNDLNLEAIKELALLLNDFGSIEVAGKLVDFIPYKNVQSFDELNLHQRRDLLKKIIKLNTIVLPENNGRTYNNNSYKIVPRTQEQFNQSIKELFLSIGINSTSSSEEDKINFLKTVNSIAKQVKTTDVDKINLQDLSLSQTSKLFDNLNQDRTPLQILKNVVNNPKFNQLSEKDKNILILSSLFINVAKLDNETPYTPRESKIEKRLKQQNMPKGDRDNLLKNIAMGNTAKEEAKQLKQDSAFEAFYIAKSIGISEEDSFKIFTLISNSDWFDEIQNADKNNIEILAEDSAYNLRYGNSFELSKILCEATSIDKAINKTEFKAISDKIAEKINIIKSSQIIVPQTKIPKASEAKNVEIMNADGVTNKVLYMDSADEDLSIYGFEKGTTKGNYHTLIHAFSNAQNLNILNSLNVVDTDSILSTSYTSTNDYRAFRNTGVILDVESDNILAGYWRDFGSGYTKVANTIKRNYIFPLTEFSKDWRKRYPETRRYISDLIKKESKLSNEEYIKKLEKISKCKSIQDIEKVDNEFAELLTQILDTIEGIGKRHDSRVYNEFLISQRKIQGTFAYDKKYEELPLWFRKYAQDNDLLLVLFGTENPNK